MAFTPVLYVAALIVMSSVVAFAAAVVPAAPPLMVTALPLIVSICAELAAVPLLTVVFITDEPRVLPVLPAMVKPVVTLPFLVRVSATSKPTVRRGPLKHLKDTVTCFGFANPRLIDDLVTRPAHTVQGKARGGGVLAHRGSGQADLAIDAPKRVAEPYE